MMEEEYFAPDMNDCVFYRIDCCKGGYFCNHVCKGYIDVTTKEGEKIEQDFIYNVFIRTSKIVETVRPTIHYQCKKELIKNYKMEGIIIE